MTVKIITDSTCDLPPSIIEDYDITVVPAYINFSDESYLDGVEISRKAFYEKLIRSSVPPTTSAPSLGTFISAYQNLIIKGADAILSIHPSATITSTYNVAVNAARSIGGFLIKPFDAGNLSMGTGIVVEAAAKLAIAGNSVDEIIKRIRDIASRTYTCAVLDTLSFLQRSGRVSKFKEIMGSLLQIKPFVNIHQHKINVEPTRTTHGAFNRLFCMIKSLEPLEKVVLLHTNALEKVEPLKDELTHRYGEIVDPYTMDVTPLIGSHLGPGAVGLTVVSSKANV